MNEDEYSNAYRFQRFIDEYKVNGEYVYSKELSSMAVQWRRWINIDYNHLHERSPTLGFNLVKNFDSVIKELKLVLIGKIKILNHEYFDEIKDVDIRIINLPITTPIYKLLARNVDSFLQIEGTVIQRNNTLKRVTNLTFKCVKCGESVKIEQDEQYRKYPVDPCICEGRKWTHSYDDSDFEDYQEIMIQELTDNTPANKNPSKIKVALRRSLVNTCEPGEDIILTGILKVHDSSPNSKYLELESYFDANSIINNTDANTINLTDKDVDEVKQLMKQNNHLQNVIQSIAPTIYGMNHIKEALALQQCEGQTRNYGKTRKRGQFHILLAGPPGYGKSELGDFMVQCHPKGRKAIGRGASGVGLTASVVRENEQFVLRAGAMALADNGFLFVDEIEKMNATDSGAMHPGMEQQEIHINKADISATLKTRCSILAACNPLGGRWDDYKTVVGNLCDKNKGLPIPLLDRFALIFVIKQNRDIQLESEVVDHIMRINTDSSILDVPYDVHCLRKIFAYARMIKVSLSEEVVDRLNDFYRVLYKASTMDDSLLITRRQPQDLMRIAEASARLNGREEASLIDAETAIRVVAESLKEYGIDPSTGKVDQLKAIYGADLNQREMIREVPKMLAYLCERNINHDKISRIEFVKYACSKWGVTEVEVGNILNVCLRDGSIFCPTPFDLSVSV